jgi:AraC family transcriptional activator of pobA
MDRIAIKLDFSDVANPPQTAIPSFFLYGEAPRTVGDRFLHLEALDDRSRPSDWNIRAHSHANLHHVFFIARGGGEMRTEDGARPFSAPCLLVVPVAVVHGFAYEPDTSGSVLTLSEPYLREIIRREPDFGALFEAPDCIAMAASSAAFLRQGLERLSREMVWTAPGHLAAVEAGLVAILVEALRASHQAGRRGPRPAGRDAELLARFRELVELHFRQGAPLQVYLDALSVTESRLRQACAKAAGCSPKRLIQDRAILEAKRVLLYSNMTVAEVGRHVGIDDPAYFSRFFSKYENESPRGFRARHEGRSSANERILRLNDSLQPPSSRTEGA